MRKKIKEMIDIIEADGWFFSRQKRKSQTIQAFN
jgi:predicted RNA binding protein YcfA (HicA-like mRNA interferase family)